MHCIFFYNVLFFLKIEKSLPMEQGSFFLFWQIWPYSEHVLFKIIWVTRVNYCWSRETVRVLIEDFMLQIKAWNANIRLPNRSLKGYGTQVTANARGFLSFNSSWKAFSQKDWTCVDASLGNVYSCLYNWWLPLVGRGHNRGLILYIYIWYT